MSKTKYLPHIDGLRAISIILVILFHFKIGPITGGFIGVDVFFTISGFLIIGSIVAQLDAGNFSALDFWQRRIRRLIPAILATLLLSLLAGFLIMSPDVYSALARQSLFALFSVINFTLLGEVDYFDQSSPDEPLLHFWSLAVEEQFYFLFPILAIFLFMFLKKSKHAKTVMMWFLVILSFASVLAAEYLMRHGQNLMAYYMMPTRFSQLAFGGVLAIALQGQSFENHMHKIPNAVHAFIMLSGMAAIIYVATKFTLNTPFPGLNSALPTFGALAILMSGGRNPLNFLLENPVASYLGKLSFSLYLVHWPVWAFLAYYLNRHPKPMEVFFAVVTSLALSAFIYHFIEKPVRFAKRFSGKSMYKVLLPALGVLVVCFATVMSLGGVPKRIAPDRMDFAKEAAKYHKVNFGGQGYDGNMTVLGHPMAEPDFLIIGDSQARQFASGIDKFLKEKNRKAILISNDGCPFIDGMITYRNGKPLDACVQRTKMATELARKYNLPIISLRYWSYYPKELRDKNGGPMLFTQGLATKQYAAMHIKFHELLNEGNLEARKIFIVGSNQGFVNALPIVDCLSRPDWFGLHCLKSNEFLADTYNIPDVEISLRDETKTNADLSYIPMPKVFCENNSCKQAAITGNMQSLVDSEIWFSNNSHLSKLGSHRFAPKLLKLANLDFDGAVEFAPIRKSQTVFEDLLTASTDDVPKLINELSKVTKTYVNRRKISNDLWYGTDKFEKRRAIGADVAEQFANDHEDSAAIYIIGFAYYFGVERKKNPVLALKYMEHPSQASNKTLKLRRATLYLDKKLDVYDRKRGMALLEEAVQLNVKGAAEKLMNEHRE